MIDALARHLRNNPDFTYTRQMTPPPPGVDPIVDFLRVSRAGHCEYFASAARRDVPERRHPCARRHGVRRL